MPPRQQPALLTTPVSDLLRGRLTRSLDPVVRLAHYDLPPEILDRALLIAKKTRLSRRERAAVAVSLGEEAAFDLDRGLTPESVLASMGDPRTRARQIRRQRLRAKPWPIRMLRGYRRRVGYALTAGALVYAFLFIRFHAGHPTLSHNYTAEFNSQFKSIPADQLGVTPFRRAIALYRPPGGALAKHWADVQPSDPEWPAALEHLKQSQETIALARAAAAAIHFGYTLSDAVDPSLDINPETRANTQPTQASPNPALLEVTLPQLGTIRGMTRLLTVDARASAAAGDAANFVLDIKSILGLARAAREYPLVIDDLVSVGCLAMAFNESGEVLASRPGLLTQDQLADLAAAIRALASGPITVRHDADRNMFLDWLQRGYTDDGHGEGRLCYQGFQTWDAMASNGSTPQSPLEMHLLGPLISSVWASRQQLTDEYTKLDALDRADAATPPWQRTTVSSIDELDRLKGSNTLKQRYAVILMLAPNFGKALSSADEINIERSGLLMAIACEQFRLKNGRYPEHLTDVAPEFAPVVLTDPFDGQPVRYRITHGKPLIYSVGTNGQDDNGTMAPGRQGNFRAAHWRAPDIRAKFPGDFVLWPPVHEPRRQDDAPD